MAKFEVKGLDKLEKALKENVKLDDVKRVVKKCGGDLQDQMQENADFRGHYEGNRFVPPTGATKKSITLDIKDGGFAAEVEPTTEYSPYLEYGTRFMDAQPFVKPAADKIGAKFKTAMQKLVR